MEDKKSNVSDNQWFLAEDAPKFKDKQQCIDYAANMSALSEAIRYDCGYKCKYSSNMLGLLKIPPLWGYFLFVLGFSSYIRFALRCLAFLPDKRTFALLALEYRLRLGA